MKPADQDPAARRSPLDWPARAGAADAVLRELELRSVRRRRRRGLALGGLGALILMGAVFWPRELRGPGGEPAAAVVVVRPERRVLPDGSVAELREGAELAVAFTETTRRLVLAKGEAHFQVTKNHLKPFVVETGGVEVLAVGTAFSVMQTDEQVEIVVTEGRVAVNPAADSGPAAPVYLDAGHRAVVDRRAHSAAVEPVTPSALAMKLAWRVPRLEFSGTPLAEVIRSFNQHNAVQLQLTDAAMRRLKLSGIIRADNTDALLQLLSVNYGITGELRADGTIVLRR